MMGCRRRGGLGFGGCRAGLGAGKCVCGGGGGEWKFTSHATDIKCIRWQLPDLIRLTCSDASVA